MRVSAALGLVPTTGADPLEGAGDRWKTGATGAQLARTRGDEHGDLRQRWALFDPDEEGEPGYFFRGTPPSPEQVAEEARRIEIDPARVAELAELQRAPSEGRLASNGRHLT